MNHLEWAIFAEPSAQAYCNRSKPSEVPTENSVPRIITNGERRLSLSGLTNTPFLRRSAPKGSSRQITAIVHNFTNLQYK